VADPDNTKSKYEIHGKYEARGYTENDLSHKAERFNKTTTIDHLYFNSQKNGRNVYEYANLT